MLSRHRVFEIHRLKDEGYTNRAIARNLKIGRNTVRRYLDNPEKTFTPRKKRVSKLDPFKPFIDECLKKDPFVSAPVLLRKIKAQGYLGQITILTDYLKEKRERTKIRKAYIRFESEPAEQMQVDWGHFGSIPYGSSLRKLYALVVIESFSRMLYVEFTHSQKQEALHLCLLNAFSYFKGTPKTILVDNMLTAVTDREAGLIRYNEAFLDFLRPFHIVPKACNLYAPYEKGKVESGVKYLRNNFLPLREYTDLTDIQTQVLEWLDQQANIRIHQTTAQSPKERFGQVKLRALPSLMPEPLECHTLSVQKDFAVKFDTNFYTTPPWTIGKKVTLKADQHTLWIHYKDKQVCSYPRCWERKRRIETPGHVEQVKKLRYKQWESKEVAHFASLGEEFREYLEHLPKSNQSLKKQIAGLLFLYDQYGLKSLSWAILKALKYKAYGTDYIENILYQEMIPIHQHPPVKLKNEALNRIRLTQTTLNDYDALILKRRKSHDKNTD
jgi:transposase